MPNYGQASYWDKRYVKQSGTTFDWLENYGTIRSILNDYLVQPKYEIWVADQERMARIEEEEERLRQEAEEERLKQQKLEQEEAKNQSFAPSQQHSNHSENQEEREAEVESQNNPSALSAANEELEQQSRENSLQFPISEHSQQQIEEQ